MKQAGDGRCTNVRGKAACFFMQEIGIGIYLIIRHEHTDHIKIIR